MRRARAAWPWIAALGACGAAAGQRAVDTPIVFVQVPAAAVDAATPLVDALPRLSGVAAGSRIVRLAPGARRAGPQLLTAGFVAAGRPDVSFDGRRILFVGRRAEEPPAVWEIGADGTGLRSVVRCPNGCTDAIYLSTLYTIDSVRPEPRIAFGSRDDRGIDALYTCRLDGGDPRQITHHPFGASEPYLLSDGRVLFTLRSTASDRTAAEFHTSNVDGSDLRLFAARPELPRLRTTAAEGGDGAIAFAEIGLAPEDRGARISRVPRTRTFLPVDVLAEEREGWVLFPAPLPDGRLLVSHRGPRDPTCAVRVLDPDSGPTPATVFDDPLWHDVDAHPIVPRTAPPGRASSLDERSDRGSLYCLDAYVSDREPAPDGTPIAAVRILAWEGERPSELGTAEVAPDGSFSLTLPARTPLRLETLDAAGGVLRRQDSWFWIMPKESRGCIGCHEHPASTPPNRHVAALRSEPVVLGLEAPGPAAGPGESRR